MQWRSIVVYDFLLERERTFPRTHGSLCYCLTLLLAPFSCWGQSLAILI